MNSPLQNLVTTKEASESSGYTSDYLARLVRSGEIEGRKIGHNWFVDRVSLEEFRDKQRSRKLDRARELSDTRSREYHGNLQDAGAPARTVPKELIRKTALPAAEVSLAPVSFASHLVAFTAALAIVGGGAFVAQASVGIQAAGRVVAFAQEAADGFKIAFGDAPAQVAARFANVDTMMRTSADRVAMNAASAEAAYASLPLAQVTPATMRSFLVKGYETRQRAVFAQVPSYKTSTYDPIDWATFGHDTYAFVTSPSRIHDVLSNAYLSVGMSAYRGIESAFSAYEAFVNHAGQEMLVLGTATRDALVASPSKVSRAAVALGEAVQDLTHAAIRADVALAYGTAEAAPASARAVVAFLGSTGSTLANTTEQIPHAIADGYLAAAAWPATAGPQLASSVFGLEYQAAHRFVTFTDDLSSRYLAVVEGAGAFAYGATEHAKSAGSLLAVVPEWLTSDSLARTHIPQAVAAVVAAVPDLSAGQQAALTVYQTVSGFLGAAKHFIASLIPAPQNVAVQTPAPAVATTTERIITVPQNVTTYPTYTTVVRGASQEYVAQSISSLRAEVLATVANMIAPIAHQTATNITTIQQVNRIQDLSDLIVRNGDFRGGTFDNGRITNGISVSANTGTFTTLSGGSTSLATTTITGNLTLNGNQTISGSLTIGTTTITGPLSTSGTITGTYFVATSTTATSTLAGSLNIDSGGFVYATSTRNVGIGVLSPAALLAIQNSTSTQPIFTVKNAAGTEVYRITDSGFVGIGSTSPTYNLAVEGTSSLGNNAIAGYFTATSTTATSTFAGALAVGTTSPVAGALFTVGTSTPLLHISSNTGYIGIGTSSPAVALDLYATTAMRIPVGTTAQRPSGDVGYIRYNTTTHQFEGYGDNSVWQGLGGVINAAQTTYITAGTDDFLRFVTSSVERMTITAAGLVGIGSTSPTYNFSVEGTSSLGNNAIAGYFTATSTTASQFPYASTTALSAYNSLFAGSTATSTIAGDYNASSIRGALTVYGNTTSGSASSLTLQRGSTNGDNTLAFNDQTGSPLLKLYTSANTGYSYLTGYQSYLSLGTSLGGQVLRIDTSGNITTTANVIPSANQTYNLGSPAVYWNNAYINNIVANNLSSASTSIAGTNTSSFSIYSNNPTTDTQDISLIFYRGAGASSNGVLAWNSTLKRFDLNQNLHIVNDSTAPASTTLVVQGVSGQTGPLTSWLNSAGEYLATLTSSGSFGIGTSSPYASLSIAGSAGGTSSLFAISTSTAGYATTTALSVDRNGNLSLLNGASLTVSGTTSFSGSFSPNVGSNVLLSTNASGNIVATSSPTADYFTATSTTASQFPYASTTAITASGTGYFGSLGGAAFSSLTTNYLPKWGNGTFSNSLIFDNGTNVGIGTTSPSALLSIQNNVSTSSPVVSLFDSTGATSLELRASTSTLNNTFIGVNAGAVNTTGSANTVIGYGSFPVNTTGYSNVAVGFNTLFSNTTGYSNTALGINALYTNTSGYENVSVGRASLYSNTTGTWNSATGYRALYSNTTGVSNTANGWGALNKTTTGSYNSAIGDSSLYFNTTGASNVAVGAGSLYYNNAATSSVAIGRQAGRGTAAYANQGGVYVGYRSGYSAATGSDFNTFVGYTAGYNTTTGTYNIANGAYALYSNTTGNFNSALGVSVLYANTTGSYNVADGFNTLRYNTTGSYNVADGTNALFSNTTGANNVAEGASALYYNASATSSVAVGYAAASGAAAYANQGGTYLGYQSGYSAATGSDYNTLVGYQSGYGITTGSNNIWIGAATSSTAIANLTTGSQNILIGNNISLPSATASGQLNIGNIIFGTGITGTGSTVSTGNIGVGTAGPGAKLHIYDGGTGTSDSDLLRLQTTYGTNSAKKSISWYDTTNVTGQIDTRYDGTTVDMVFGSLYNTTDLYNSTARMVIKGNGNVGIGTTAPSAPLTIQNNVATSSPILSFLDSTGATSLEIRASTSTLLNTFIGTSAGAANTTGYYNTATGYGALYSNTTGYQNVANGIAALYANTSGYRNVATGGNALRYNTTGNNNVASGDAALFSNITGTSNVALGSTALYYNASATSTVAVGFNAAAGTAAYSNQGGVYVGYQAGYSAQTGSDYNTLVGYSAGHDVTTGTAEVALGANALLHTTTGNHNVAIGISALQSNTTGGANVAIGSSALQNDVSSGGSTAVGYQTLSANTTGANNVGLGYYALVNNKTGSNNVALGGNSLQSNITGSENTAVGLGALYYNASATSSVAIGRAAAQGTAAYSNQGGVYVGYLAGYSAQTGSDYNTFVGYTAGYNTTTGYWNVGNGYESLYSNTTGDQNIALGPKALRSNTTGRFNFAGGAYALYSNTTGTSNVAIGNQVAYFNSSATSTVAIGYYAAQGTAAYSNQGGVYVGYLAGYSAQTGSDYNTFVGYQSGYSDTVGFYNTASGYTALYSNAGGSYNNAYGSAALQNTTGSQNTAIGSGAGSGITSGSNNIAIGYNAQVPTPTASNQIRLGDANITYAGIQVSWTVTSDRKYKTDIKPVAFGLDFVNQLQPVDYLRVNDASGGREAGFVAQDVNQTLLSATSTAYGLISYDPTAAAYSLRYNDFIPILTRAVQQLDTKVNLIASSTASTTQIFVDTTGNVGIGTTSPNHTLTIAGDVGAIAFVNTSTRTAKTDISYVGESASDEMYDQLLKIKVANYRYKIEPTSDPLRLGFIAEEVQQVAPEILSPDGKGVDLYKLATFTLSGVQTLAGKVDAQGVRLASLEDRVAKLESGDVSVASGSPVSFSSASLASALSGFGVLIDKGIAQFNTLVFRTLVASSDADGTSSAGSVTILTGNTVAQVNNALVKPSTKIFVTFNAQLTGSWWVSDKADGSFRVVLSDPQTGDVSFDYFLVQTEGQIATPTASGYQGISQSSGPDTVAPVITLLGDNPVYLSVGGTFTEPGVTVTDNADGTDPYKTYVNGIEQAADAGTIDTSSPTTYIITYTARDAAGNTTSAHRSVIVGNPDGTVSADSGSPTSTTTTTTSGASPTSTDTTAPVVTLNGSAAMELVQSGTFTDPGATATDDTDGDLTAKVVETGSVDTATTGLYTLTYSATDAAGNTGSVSRVVSVVAPAAATTTETTATGGTASSTPAQ